MSRPFASSASQASTTWRKSLRQRPKLSFTYTTGTPASRARSASLAMRSAAGLAAASSCSASGKSKGLMTSMSSSAARWLSGALPCKSVSVPLCVAISSIAGSRGDNRGAAPTPAHPKLRTGRPPGDPGASAVGAIAVLFRGGTA